MSQPARATVAHEFAIEAYGVRMAIGASDARLQERVAAVLPPGAHACEPEAVNARFALVEEDGVFRATAEGGPDLRSVDPEIAAGLLDAMVRTHVALHAHGRIFIHAGAVAYGGRAIVLPGQSMSGKTTLVAALVAEGAVYYSEEYAVLDAHGFVHPYPKPLSIRRSDMVGVDTPVEALGGVAGEAPVPVGLVAVATYAPGARWDPRRLSRSEGVLALLSHAIAARERPEEAFAAVHRAAPPVTLEGERGDAAETARALLGALED